MRSTGPGGLLIIIVLIQHHLECSWVRATALTIGVYALLYVVYRCAAWLLW